jgi:translocation and assembly module TamB
MSNGNRAMIPFHVSSGDWQESDRLLSGLMTAFGNPTRPIPIGGSGTFDGMMTGAFRQPRIEGTFSGDRIRAFDVVWGRVTGDVVIENNYADVKSVVIQSGDSTIRTDGRYSIGYPRRDGGEEINARIRIDRRPALDLRYAFELEDYDLDGRVSGDFTIKGDYTAPLGSGTLRIDEGIAYGEPFEEATAGLRLEGNGVRLDNIRMAKGGGRGEGSAFIDWDGRYSFNFEAAGLEVDRLAATQGSPLPLAGLLDFTATGSGNFDAPRYTVRGTLRDLFVADEGIGQVVGNISVDGRQMVVKLEAASARLAVSGGGIIAMTPDLDAELSFNVTETSLDPYVRAFQPRLSPFTTAVVSGTLKVQGKLRNIDELFVDATVDDLDLRLFDYRLRNPEGTPIRMALDRHIVRISEFRLVGPETDFDLSGTIGLHDEPSTDLDERRIQLRGAGNANLSVLQGFFRNVRSTGRASLDARLDGPLADPVMTGKMQISDGRIRHFGLPHALDTIAGALTFDTRVIRLDELSGRIGLGPVQFGGTIGIEEYRLGRVDVTATGTDMQLRFPQGMRSRVDANLEVQGTSEGLTVRGNVTVNDATYSGNFDTGAMFGGAGDDGVPRAPSYTAPVVPIAYDVQITAMSTVRVQNELLRNIVASADLRLAGSYERPQLFGQVTIERGEINFEAKRYVIRRGSIAFDNPTVIEPFLDIETEARVQVPGETYRVTVRATGELGRPNSPTLDFASEPPLPRDEIIALLAADVAPGQDVEFRRYAAGSGGITPQEQLFREQAARQVTGAATAELNRAVQQAIGVDFRVTPTISSANQAANTLDPGLRVMIGKQAGRVYITYSRSTTSTRDQIIQIEINQTDRLSWILTRNEEGRYSLDVQVRRTF